MQKVDSKKSATCKELADVNDMMKKINSIKLKKQSSMALINKLKERKSGKSCSYSMTQRKPFSDLNVLARACQEHIKSSIIIYQVDILKKYLNVNSEVIEVDDVLASQIKDFINFKLEDEFEYICNGMRLSKIVRLMEKEFDRCNIIFIEYEEYVFNCLQLIYNIHPIFNESIYQNSILQIQRNFYQATKSIIKTTDRPFLALDLDETLIHSESLDSPYNYSHQCDLIIKELNIGVWVRPYIYSFLEFCQSNFDLYLFSAGSHEYTNAILRTLQLEKYFLFKLDRSYCIKVGGIFVKDLSIFSEYNDGLLVDNNLFSFSLNLDQGFLVSPFIYNKSDEELKDAEEFLREKLEESQREEILLKELNEDHFMFQKLFNKFPVNTDDS